MLRLCPHLLERLTPAFTSFTSCPRALEQEAEERTVLAHPLATAASREPPQTPERAREALRRAKIALEPRGVRGRLAECEDAPRGGALKGGLDEPPLRLLMHARAKLPTERLLDAREHQPATAEQIVPRGGGRILGRRRALRPVAEEQAQLGAHAPICLVRRHPLR